MSELTIHRRPTVDSPVMLLGFTGWMDGGRVSTGTISYLNDKLGAREFAEIEPLDFYILNFPASTIPVSVYSSEGKTVLTSVNPMEFAAVFRPHTKIESGSIRELVFPQNRFHCSESANVVLFSGEEPHIRWGAYSDCILGLAKEFGISQLYFVGSVAGAVPHTREPTLWASVSSDDLKEELRRVGLSFTDYEGPSSLVTSLAYRAADHGVKMRMLVVEVPHYPFLEMPTYPKSILKVNSVLTTVLGLDVDLSDLQKASAAADEKLEAIMEENDEFKDLVAKLEEEYDRSGSTADVEALKRLMEGIDLEGDESLN